MSHIPCSFIGEYRIPKSQFPECCWDCAKCDEKSFTNTSNMTNCVECPEGTWPTAEHSDCRPIEARYLHWGEAWAVAIVTLSLTGFTLVVSTCLLFVKSRGTAVVKAASRQLSHVLLLGIALFYLTPLCYIIQPSENSCKLLPFMFGMCFALVVGKLRRGEFHISHDASLHTILSSFRTHVILSVLISSTGTRQLKERKHKNFQVESDPFFGHL